MHGRLECDRYHIKSVLAASFSQTTDFTKRWLSICSNFPKMLNYQVSVSVSQMYVFVSFPHLTKTTSQ